MRILAATLCVLVTFAGCTSPPEDPRAVFAQPTAEPSVLAGDDASTLAVAASRAFYSSAPIVIVVPGDDTVAAQEATSLSRRLSAPVLTDSDAEALGAEVTRLDVQEVIALNDATVTDSSSYTITEATMPLADDARIAKTKVSAPKDAENFALLATGDDSELAARATAESAGATVHKVPTGDVRASSTVIGALKDKPQERVVGLGSVFGEGPDLAVKVATARKSPELPGGGQLVFEDKRMVALYGSPEGGALGVLGEAGLKPTIKRVSDLAEDFSTYSDEQVVPAFEIIATVASAGAEKDKSYSRKTPISRIKPYVDAAEKAGIYVVLDLQPGRQDFLTQAKLYEPLLRRPHVGLALDPEWRLEPDEKHLEQIGSVTAGEVNRVNAWLADLTRANALPQKLVILQQFRSSMISDRQDVDTSRDELAVLIHADGQGAQGDKQTTWRVLREDAPEGVFWGWKNFYDEDKPMLSVEDTFTTIDPKPHFVSYQ